MRKAIVSAVAVVVGAFAALAPATSASATLAYLSSNPSCTPSGWAAQWTFTNTEKPGGVTAVVTAVTGDITGIVLPAGGVRVAPGGTLSHSQGYTLAQRLVGARVTFHWDRRGQDAHTTEASRVRPNRCLPPVPATTTPVPTRTTTPPPATTPPVTVSPSASVTVTATPTPTRPSATPTATSPQDPEPTPAPTATDITPTAPAPLPGAPGAPGGTGGLNGLGDGALPVTGAAATTAAGLGALLLAGGAVTLWLMRRRRTPKFIA